jgi:RNA:NAD 2'-phosphotransferase (TPT1/KptA family)
MNKRMKDMSEADREFARQAWVENDWDGYVNLPKLIELVRADEREACAQLIESLFIPDDAVSEFIAEAIRARGQA